MKKILIYGFILALLFFIVNKLYKPKRMNTDEKNVRGNKLQVNNYTEQDAKNAIEKVKEVYGTDTAKAVEKIYRWETDHFRSTQYRLTGTAGMTKGNWLNLPKLPTITGIGTVNKAGERSKETIYYVWNPLDAAMYVAEFLQRNGNNLGRWNSKNATAQKNYIAKLNGVKTQYA